MSEAWGSIPDLYVNPLSSADFNCALKKYFWNRLASWVTDDNNYLLSLEDYMLCKQLTHWQDGGVETVSVDQIRGSDDGSQTFDISFMPHQQQIRHRWTSVDRAHFQNAASLQIDLIKIEDIYFVLDGHDQLSAASTHNQASIEAHVIKVEEDIDC